MSDKISLAEYPWTSVSPSALSTLDLGNIDVAENRALTWWGRPAEYWEKAVENPFGLLAFIEQADMETFELTSPTAKWKVSRPADMWTRNSKAIAAGDIPDPGSVGYIELDDSMLISGNHTLYCPDYDVSLRVLDVDHDHSEAWANGAADACNAKVERIGGGAVDIPAGTVFNIGPVVMAEEGVPSKGITSTPGEAVWNSMQYVGIYGSITRVQDESVMNTPWGTHPKIKDEVYFQHRLRKQNAWIFGRRYTGSDSQGDGQMWVSDGIVAQIKNNIMNAGSVGANLVWPKLNELWENSYDSLLSAAVKHHFCGSAQFRAIRKTAIEYGAEVEMIRIQSGVQNPQTLGVPTMRVILESGKPVEVHELRQAFAAPNLVDWGITLDANNIGLGSYRGISEVWFNDIESNAQRITVISDALIDTWLLAVKDEQTCAVIRGGAQALLER